MSSTRARAEHVPYFDGLRAIAVLLVVLFHQHVLPWGWVGVQIFFTLSGYLITRLLFEARHAPLAHYLRIFYGRRALRIFPLYFGFLLLVALGLAFGAPFGGTAEGLPYAVTYTYNFFHASSHFAHSSLLSHFWSLCVEEQFYLFWPFLIYFCPARWLHFALSALVLVGPALRLVLASVLPASGLPLFPRVEIALYVLTPTHIDAFAAGAYVALFRVPRARVALAAAAAVTLLAGLASVASGAQGNAAYPLSWTSLGFPWGLDGAYGYVWGYSALNITSAMLLACLAQGSLSPRFLEFRWLRYLGKISYGLYVFHYPTQALVGRLLPEAPVLLQCAVQCAVTIAVSSACFHFWETRFLRLKQVWFAPGRAEVAPLAAVAG